MSANLEAKKTAVEEIKNLISSSKSIVLVDYKGLNVSDDETYIPIRVNSMDDIISNYSVRNNEMLSEEFINSHYFTLHFMVNNSFCSIFCSSMRSTLLSNVSLRASTSSCAS